MKEPKLKKFIVIRVARNDMHREHYFHHLKQLQMHITPMFDEMGMSCFIIPEEVEIVARRLVNEIGDPKLMEFNAILEDIGVDFRLRHTGHGVYSVLGLEETWTSPEYEPVLDEASSEDARAGRWIDIGVKSATGRVAISMQGESMVLRHSRYVDGNWFVDVNEPEISITSGYGAFEVLKHIFLKEPHE